MSNREKVLEQSATMPVWWNSFSIREFGEQADKLRNRRVATKVSWELYGGLYRIFSSMGPYDGAYDLGWSRAQSADVLVRAHKVAGIALNPPHREYRPHNRIGPIFTALCLPLTEQLDANKAVHKDVLNFNDAMIEGYAVMAESETVKQFLDYKGLQKIAFDGLQAAEHELNRQVVE